MTFSPPSQPYTWTFRQVVGATLLVIAVVFGFWILYRFNQVFFLVSIAILIGTVIRPLVTWLSQKGISRIGGILLIYIFIFVLLIGFMLLLFPLVVEQSTTISKAIPGYYQTLRMGMINYPIQFIARIGEFLPSTWSGLLPVTTQQTGEEVMASAEQVLSIVALTSRVIFVAFVILILAFYWTLDGPRIIQSFLLFVRQEQRESIRELISAIETKISFYMTGQAFLCLIIGILALLAYLLIGLPNAFVLALFAGLLEAVPVIGPILGAIPAMLVALSVGPERLIWVIVATVVIQQLENSFLVPHVMRRAVGVNPFVTLLSLFAFTYLYGIPGALMAIPIAAIIQLLFNHFVFHSTAEPEVSSGRDYASRLRYEAQELAKDLRKQVRLTKEDSDIQVKQIDQVMDEIETIALDLDSLLDSSASDSS